MNKSKQEIAEWAYIFQTLGEEGVRESLYHVATELDRNDALNVTIQYGGPRGRWSGLDITDHVRKLEEIASEEAE